MKKLVIALALGMGLTGFAQETAPQPQKANMEKKSPEQRQQKHLARLTKELNLDAKQQEVVGKILAEKSAKAQDLKTQKNARKANGDKMSTEEKTNLKNTLQAEKTDTEARMKAILSPDQYQKWLTIRDQNTEKAKEKMKTKKGGL